MSTKFYYPNRVRRTNLKNTYCIRKSESYYICLNLLLKRNYKQTFLHLKNVLFCNILNILLIISQTIILLQTHNMHFIRLTFAS